MGSWASRAWFGLVSSRHASVFAFLHWVPTFAPADESACFEEKQETMLTADT